MNPIKRSRVVAYLRVSTEDQASRGISLEAQRAKVEQYCRLYELDLVAVCEDAGVSAKTTDRPGLRRALGLLESREADGLLVAKLDRLTRSVGDLGALLSRYFEAGTWGLMSVAENVDTTTAAGRLVLNVLVSVAQWEREAIGERTRDALSHLRAKGVRNGRAGLGWRYSDARGEDGRRKIVSDPGEAATLRLIVRLREEGATYSGIARELDKRGKKTKRGGSWDHSTVRKILSRQKKAPAGK